MVFIMRVIAGSARRLLLKTPKGLNTRPTTDRIKETLFNILAPEIPGSRFLDLFSGSGGIGIEALSRGAEYAAFVDNSKEALSCIKENIAHTRFTDNSEVIGCDVITAIKRLSGKEPFDVVFMDPPYESDLTCATLLTLSNSNIITDDTLIICEALLETDFSFALNMGYEIKREKEYKTNKHVFLKIAINGDCDV